MEERYALILKGKKIGTVHLDPEQRGVVRATLAPLPAFRDIARHHRALEVAKQRALMEEDPTPAELAAADGAAAVLKALPLTLQTDPGGVTVAVEEIKILRGNPPRLRVRW